MAGNDLTNQLMINRLKEARVADTNRVRLSPMPKTTAGLQSAQFLMWSLRAGGWPDALRAMRQGEAGYSLLTSVMHGLSVSWDTGQAVCEEKTLIHGFRRWNCDE